MPSEAIRGCEEVGVLDSIKNSPDLLGLRFLRLSTSKRPKTPLFERFERRCESGGPSGDARVCGSTGVDRAVELVRRRRCSELTWFTEGRVAEEKEIDLWGGATLVWCV